MINARHIHTFNTPRISAASGLVLHEDRFYVISDDELCLVELALDFSSVRLHALFEGTLPEEKKERKKLKPDLEGMTLLSNGSILCLPSGSKINRSRGAILKRDKTIERLNLDHNYRLLLDEISELNIEGVFVEDETICLLQRGNGEARYNAIIRTDLKNFLSDKMTDFWTSSFDLGSLRGVPLSFTDVTIDQSGIWFLAAAEATESTYDDGEFVGSVVGKIENNKIVYQEELAIPSKPEGIAKYREDFYIVTDDDDRNKPSKMYTFTI